MNYFFVKDHPHITTVQLRVLHAIVDARHFGELVTVRSLQKKFGYRSPNAVHLVLKRLLQKGLIGWDKGKGGTVMPKVSLLVIDNPPEDS